MNIEFCNELEINVCEMTPFCNFVMCVTGHEELGLACLITPLVLAPTSAQTPTAPSAAADGAGWTVQQLTVMKTGCQDILKSTTTVRRLIATVSGTVKVTAVARS